MKNLYSGIVLALLMSQSSAFAMDSFSEEKNREATAKIAAPLSSEQPLKIEKIIRDYMRNKKKNPTKMPKTVNNLFVDLGESNFALEKEKSSTYDPQKTFEEKAVAFSKSKAKTKKTSDVLDKYRAVDSFSF